MKWYNLLEVQSQLHSLIHWGCIDNAITKFKQVSKGLSYGQVTKIHPRTKFMNTSMNTKIFGTTKFIMFDIGSKINSHANKQGNPTKV